MDALKLKEVTLFQSSPEYLRFSKELYDVRPLEKTLDLAVLVRLIRETDTLRLSFGEKDTLHATLAHVQTSTYRDFAKIFIYESNKTE